MSVRYTADLGYVNLSTDDIIENINGIRLLMAVIAAGTIQSLIVSYNINIIKRVGLHTVHFTRSKTHLVRQTIMLRPWFK